MGPSPSFHEIMRCSVQATIIKYTLRSRFLAYCHVVPQAVWLNWHEIQFILSCQQHWFRYWLGACSAPIQYLNQCWFIVTWDLNTKLQWNCDHTRHIKFMLHKVPDSRHIIPPVWHQAITWTSADLWSAGTLTPNYSEIVIKIHIDGLVQDCNNSIAIALELLQSCTKPSMCTYIPS